MKVFSYNKPQSGFKCLSEDQWSRLNWVTQREDQFIGYFVDCALQYHLEIHDSHKDYPLAPERVIVTPNVMSEMQVEVALHYSRGLRQNDVKLLPSLLNTVRYVTQYLNLKF